MKNWQFIIELHGQRIRGIASPSVGTFFVVRSGRARRAQNIAAPKIDDRDSHERHEKPSAAFGRNQKRGKNHRAKNCRTEKR
jgi:hypothetical protein